MFNCWKMNLPNLITPLLVFLISFSFGQSDTYSTKYIDVPVDHFSFTNNETFKMRYLVNDKYWEDAGPIFLYTGNEGDITMFAENTGFMFEIAPHFSALVVFAEHRYYGESMPFGNLSFTSPKYSGYLTSNQALADYVYLIDYLQKTNMIGNRVSPVIAFGGSYGGMLAAWIRMKYPASVQGSIAASAPVLQFVGLRPCDIFNRILTNVYKYSVRDSDCSTVISKSWPIIRKMFKDNKDQFVKGWKLCPGQYDADAVVGWVEEIYGNMGMANYPYPNSFLMPLPANPIKQFCNKVQGASRMNDTQLINKLAEGIQIYTNFTGKTKCNDVGQAAQPSLDDRGWDFQACTEIIIPSCSQGHDMFEISPWNFEEFAQNCAKQYGIRPPREDLAILEYGGKDLSAASNIVFSNGLLDPWSGGGVMSNVSATVSAVIIPEGAHHLDLRSANPADPPSVIAARKFHMRSIHTWLREYYFSRDIFYKLDDAESFYDSLYNTI